MDTNLLNTIEDPYKKKSLPKIEVGDTIELVSTIRDAKGEKVRSQTFKGLVLSMKGSGLSQTVTVRKISHGIGVEKIFPIHSPNTEEVKILKKGDVRQSKIFYMRDRVGRSAMKVNESTKEAEMIQYVEEEEVETPAEVKEEVAEVKAEEKTEEKVEEKAEEAPKK